MKDQIGKKLRQARTTQGLTQKELAQQLGCTEIMISRYELGVSQLSIPRLKQIAAILDKPLAYFFAEKRSSIENTSHYSRGFKKAFVFDLDDTLIDGRGFCGETIARVITDVEPSANFRRICEIHEAIRGMTIEDLYTTILKKLRIATPIQPLLEQDHIIQSENIDRMRLFDGVVEILEFLKSNGKHLYMCTNRTKDLMISILRSNKIFAYFDEVISCIDAGYKKPNPYCLVDIIQRSGMSSEDFIYFGDSVVDSQFAQNAGIDFIIFDQYLNNKDLFKKLINMFLEQQINGKDAYSSYK